MLTKLFSFVFLLLFSLNTFAQLGLGKDPQHASFKNYKVKKYQDFKDSRTSLNKTNSTLSGYLDFTQYIVDNYPTVFQLNLYAIFPDSTVLFTSGSTTWQSSFHGYGINFDPRFNGFSPSYSNQDTVRIDTIFIPGKYTVVSPNDSLDKLKITVFTDSVSRTNGGFQNLVYPSGSFSNISSPANVYFPKYQGSALHGANGGLSATNKIS